MMQTLETLLGTSLIRYLLVTAALLILTQLLTLAAWIWCERFRQWIKDRAARQATEARHAEICRILNRQRMGKKSPAEIEVWTR